MSCFWAITVLLMIALAIIPFSSHFIIIHTVAWVLKDSYSQAILHLKSFHGSSQPQDKNPTSVSWHISLITTFLFYYALHSVTMKLLARSEILFGLLCTICADLLAGNTLLQILYLLEVSPYCQNWIPCTTYLLQRELEKNYTCDNLLNDLLYSHFIRRQMRPSKFNSLLCFFFLIQAPNTVPKTTLNRYSVNVS